MKCKQSLTRYHDELQLLLNRKYVLWLLNDDFSKKKLLKNNYKVCFFQHYIDVIYLKVIK